MIKTILYTSLLILLVGKINAQTWHTNLEGAIELASFDNKKIILVFSGSDWCAPCMKLENEIWKSKEFINHAEKNYVLVKADFPRKKKNELAKELKVSNAALAKKYNQNGFFPLVVVMNAEEKVLGQTGYKKISPDKYINLLDSF